MSTKKSGGSSGLGRDSNAKRLGLKLHDGMPAKAGSVIVKQKGNRFYSGKNTAEGKDCTIYATKEGKVKFITKQKKTFQGKTKKVNVVNVD